MTTRASFVLFLKNNTRKKKNCSPLTAPRAESVVLVEERLHRPLQLGDVFFVQVWHGSNRQVSLLYRLILHRAFLSLLHSSSSSSSSRLSLLRLAQSENVATWESENEERKRGETGRKTDADFFPLPTGLTVRRSVRVFFPRGLRRQEGAKIAKNKKIFDGGPHTLCEHTATTASHASPSTLGRPPGRGHEEGRRALLLLPSPVTVVTKRELSKFARKKMGKK